MPSVSATHHRIILDLVLMMLKKIWRIMKKRLEPSTYLHLCQPSPDSITLRKKVKKYWQILLKKILVPYMSSSLLKDLNSSNKSFSANNKAALIPNRTLSWEVLSEVAIWKEWWDLVSHSQLESKSKMSPQTKCPQILSTESCKVKSWRKVSRN